MTRPRGAHTYEITLTGTGAIFRADDQVIDYYDASDMGGVWEVAPVKAYTNLWTYGPGPDWGGVWPGSEEPLVGTVHGAEMRAGDVSGSRPLLGHTGVNSLHGTNRGDHLDGRDGSGALRGDGGNNDLIGSHTDAGRGSLHGGRGEDLLVGGPGADRLEGGLGRDTLYGDQVDYPNLPEPEPETPDPWRDEFVFTNPGDSVRGSADVIYGFDAGLDRISLRGLDAAPTRAGDQHFAWSETRVAHSAWLVEVGEDVLVRADRTGDGRPDLEILLVEAAQTGVDRGDLLL